MSNIYTEFLKISKALNAWQTVIQSEQVTEKAKKNLTEATSDYEQALSFQFKKVF